MVRLKRTIFNKRRTIAGAALVLQIVIIIKDLQIWSIFHDEEEDKCE